jgi:hypothetical protein
MDPPKRGRGRPKMTDDERQVTVSFRLPPHEAQKFNALGGRVWLLARLRKVTNLKLHHERHATTRISRQQ